MGGCVVIARNRAGFRSEPFSTGGFAGITDRSRARVALMDYGAGGRHGDPLRRQLGSPRGRFALGVRVGPGRTEVWLVDELAELVDGGSSRGKAHAFTHIISHFAGLVKQLQTENAVLREENTALRDEAQTLAAELDSAREGRIGGVA
jgi:hypothetical protein